LPRVRVSFDFGDTSSLHVLVVDNDTEQRQQTLKCLASAGYTNIKSACSVKEAGELLETDAFQLILLSLSLPAMSGFSFLEQISEQHGALSIIVLANPEEASSAYKCLEKGADDYIILPIRLPVAKNMWSTVWKKKRERRTLDLLYTERAICTEKEKILKDLGQLVTKMGQRRSLETPLSVISRTIDDILGDRENQLPDTVLESLGDIQQLLHTSNIYKPDISQLFNDIEPTNDPLTERWLMEELGFGEAVIEAREGPNWEPSAQLSGLASLKFSVIDKGDESLLPLLLSMFSDLGIVERFNINKDSLRKFLCAVRDAYHSVNPYHNFRHAFDVTQCLYYYLVTGKAMEYLCYIDIFALIVATLIHDIGHPGLNNAFLVATESTLAIRYNDTSPLENFHCCSGWQIITQEGTNIIENLTSGQRAEFRLMLTNTVLSSDPARTVEVISKFEGIMNQYDKTSHSHRLVFGQFLLKCADVSNPVRAFPVSRYWAEMIQSEFFLQGDKERDLGIPISPFMDRDSPEALPRMQISFLDYVVEPLSSRLVAFLPDTNEVLTNLQNNRTTWAKYLENASD